ncbi:MAG: electron transfer flavoprotein subunit alpha/FixB family protein [Thermoflexia bacterium]|nr:MAG: electron transfer flavoprotein subunit alpha/FixB family protein [Thermoflexia bacterium]
MASVLVFCTATSTSIPRSALEVLAAARSLSQQLGRGPAQALLLGAGIEHQASALIHHGADGVFLVDHPCLESPGDELALEITERVVRQVTPRVVLFPHDDLAGGHVAPRLAYRLRTGIVTDCTGFSVQDEEIRWLRPVYGGKAMAYMRAWGPVQIATIRSRAFEPLPANPSRQGEVHPVDINPETFLPAVKVVERVEAPEAEGGLSLDRAEIIVSGGRGIGSAEGFQVLHDLARVLGAAVGGSRPAADMGWVPHSHLVGQTGKIVAPKLYIAVGISGATQHMAGAGSSRTIVAINKDPDAPIFKLAHIGVVGEWEKIIPPLIQVFQEMRSRG